MNDKTPSPEGALVERYSWTATGMSRSSREYSTQLYVAERHLDEAADTIERLERSHAELVEALKEILWQCGGRVDINVDGEPNLAMVVDSIAYAAIAAAEKVGKSHDRAASRKRKVRK